MGTYFSKRGGHHNGVISGHEIMAYAFLSGTQCQPKRKILKRYSKREDVPDLFLQKETGTTGRNGVFEVSSLSRSPSPTVFRHTVNKRDSLDAFDTEDISGDNEPTHNIDVEYSLEVVSGKESDSGISINLSHFDPDLSSQARQEDTVSESKNSMILNLPPPPPVTPPPIDLPSAVREFFKDEYSTWYEPSGKKDRTHSRRKSSTRSLHQKLVVSKNNIRKATKLDMDDRAKMLQYFTRSNDENGYIKVEELFTKSWRIPLSGMRTPTVITVQAPAGIGKSSMLKYMCHKWSNSEMWQDNFDLLIFIECRTLNHIGSMSCKEYLAKILQSPLRNVDNTNDFFSEILAKASVGRLLFLLDGLDEITDVANLTNLNQKFSVDDILSPIEFTQAIICGRLAPGSHVIVTSRPHTLTYLQSSRWFINLQKSLISLDIQGLSEEGVCAFIHSFVENKISTDEYEVLCTEICPCRVLQQRALSDRYIFSLASNPFYLWLLCTIFYEAGEGYIPRTLTQLYTWVILVFSNKWLEQKNLTLEKDTVDFLKGFSKLCYNLVQNGSIKMSANLDETGTQLTFPDLQLTLDMNRAQTYGMMVISKSNREVECEFRHLSLAEYLSAVHIHTTGEPLRGFAKDRKELILQYLSGLASSSPEPDQKVVENFLKALGVTKVRRDPVFYLNIIQKMKGEWYNQEGLQKQMLFMRCIYESQVDQLTMFPFPGLKIINIRGNVLLTLDLIIINNFVTKLQSDNNLLELSLRDQIIDMNGLKSISPCLHLVRTVRLNGYRFTSECMSKLINVVSELRGNLRELYVHEISSSVDSECVLQLKNTCKKRGIKTNL